MPFDWDDLDPAVNISLGELTQYNSLPFDATTNPYGLADGGHIQLFPEALDDTVTVVNVLPAFADLMSAMADSAAASAVAAASAADSLSGTSATPLTLSTAEKTLTTQAGKSFQAGRIVRATSDANPDTHWFDLLVTSYSDTTVIGTVLQFSGSGSRSDWTLRVGARPGRPAGNVFLWSTDTDNTDPNSGYIKANAGTPPSATSIYISETDFYGSSLSSLIATWDDGTSAIRGRLRITQISDPSNWAEFDINGTLVDNGAWDTFTVTYRGAGGTLVAGAMVAVEFDAKGDVGTVGGTGTTPGHRFNFLTDIADADPASGNFKANHATFASITKLWFDNLDAAGASATAWLDRLDDSVNANHRGYLRVQKTDDPLTYMEFVVTGPVVDKTGYREVPVSPVTTAGTFTNTLACAANFSASGIDGTNGTNGFTPGYSYTFDDPITDADPTPGKLRFDHATFASITKIWIDNVDGAGATVTTWLDSLYASTNNNAATGKARVRIEKTTDRNVFREFIVTAGVDKTGYRELTVTPQTSAGSFADEMAVVVNSNVTGNKGSDGAGSGDVTTDGAVTAGHLAVYADTTGDLLEDGGAPFSGAYGDLSGQPPLGTAAALNTGTTSGTVAAVGAGDKVAASIIPIASTTAVGGNELATAAEYHAADAVRLATGGLEYTAAADVASAATCNIGAAASRVVRITGTTGITAFDNVAAGIRRKGYFAGILTMTHNGSSLILPSAANIITAADDRFEALSLGAGNWIVLLFERASGRALVNPTGMSTATEATDATIRTGTATNEFISPAKLYTSAAPVTLTDGATVTPDMNAGINFDWIIGGNRALANPTNMKIGQSGAIRIKQDATGSRIITFGTKFMFPGGDPLLSTAANAVDILWYWIFDANTLYCTLTKAHAA